MTDLFTPLNAERTQRLTFPIEQVLLEWGSLHYRMVGAKAGVSIDGKRYTVIGTDCDLEGCTCDSYLVDESALFIVNCLQGAPLSSWGDPRTLKAWGEQFRDYALNEWDDVPALAAFTPEFIANMWEVEFEVQP